MTRVLTNIEVEVSPPGPQVLVLTWTEGTIVHDFERQIDGSVVVIPRRVAEVTTERSDLPEGQAGKDLIAFFRKMMEGPA